MQLTMNIIFSRLGYLFGHDFQFCLELALDWKLEPKHFLYVHDLSHNHSFSELQWSRLPDQQTLLLTENCLQYQKWCPYTCCAH